MRYRGQNGVLRIVFVAVAAAAGSLATPSDAPAQTAASAQARTAMFDIPAQPLASALAAFARQSGIRLAYPASLAAGRFAPAVSGSMASAAALSRLLSGTSLTYRFTGPRTVAIADPAAATSSAGDGSLLLDTINVTANTSGVSEDTAYLTPGSSTYISREEIERFRGTSPGDFLEGTPGVLVGAKRNSGAVDVNIRGMQGMDRVPVTVDGAQQGNTVWRGYAGVASRTYIDPDFISEVNIEKGPTLSSDGTGATGGVVSMKTVGADDILKPGQSVGVRLRGGVVGNSTSPAPFETRGGIDGALTDTTYAPGTLPDSFGFTQGFDRPALLEPASGHGSIAGAVRTEKFEFVAAAARRKLGNYFAGENGDDAGHVALVPDGGGTRAELRGLTYYQAGEEVLNTANDSTSYLLKGAFTPGDGHRLELTYSKYLSTYFEMFPSQVTWFGGPWQERPSNVELDTYTATHTWNPADNDLIDLRTNLWMTDIRFEIGQSTPTILPGNPKLEYTSNVDALRRGVNISNASRLHTALGKVKLDYGVSYTEEEMKQTTTTGVLLPYFPTPMTEPGKSGDRQEWSAFLASQWTPRDWLTLDGGVRYTSTRSHDDCLVSSSADCRDLSSDGWAPLAAVTVEPWDGIQLYGRYAEAIRSPSLYESTTGESFNEIAFGLQPEHARNWEFGLNVLRDGLFTPGDAFRFKAAYFDNDIDNYLTRTDNTAGSGIGFFAMRNLDYARFKGFEVSARYDTGSYFAELGYVRYLDTEFCLKEEDAIVYDSVRCSPAGVYGGYAQLHVPPEQTVSLTLGKRFLDDTLTVGGRLSYIGERPADDLGGGSGGGFTVLTEWNEYLLVDLFASWRINETLEAEINIDNLTDIYYVDPLSVGLMPAPGRTFRAALSARF